MANFGKVISLNDEAIEIPKIRKDQQRRIQNMVRTNDPLIAIGLVRDYAKGLPFVRAIQFDNEENPTCIAVSLKSEISKMSTMYTFKLEAPVLLETPTLD